LRSQGGARPLSLARRGDHARLPGAERGDDRGLPQGDDGDDLPVQARSTARLQLLREVTKVDDPALLEETLNDTLPNLADPPIYPTVRGTQNVLDWLGESDAKARGMAAEQFIDDRLVRQIEASGFVESLGAGQPR